MRFYMNTWQGHGTWEELQRDAVVDELREHAANIRDSHPWPTIHKTPVRERDDGRFVKAFPLEFPSGTGDLHQPRMRSDFTAIEWAQHLLRYYDGRMLASNRGHRVVWAIFNTAMRELSRQQGNLVVRTHNASVVTKAELEDFVKGRDDLLHSLCSFGADIPTTSMHWKREGNKLEWIVRQMMWHPPWVVGSEDHLGEGKPRRTPQKHPVEQQDDVEHQVEGKMETLDSEFMYLKDTEAVYDLSDDEDVVLSDPPQKLDEERELEDVNVDAIDSMKYLVRRWPTRQVSHRWGHQRKPCFVVHIELSV